MIILNLIFKLIKLMFVQPLFINVVLTIFMCHLLYDALYYVVGGLNGDL